MKSALKLVAFLVFILFLSESFAQKYHIISGTGWKSTGTYAPGWNSVFFDDNPWGNSALIAAPNFGSVNPVPGANHMWNYPYNNGDTVYFRTTFDLKSTCYKSGYMGTTNAQFKVDNNVWIYVNGQLAAQSSATNSGLVNIQPFLRVGKNVIAIKAWNKSCSAAICPYHLSFAVDVDYLSGPEIVMDPDKNVCDGDSVFFGPKDHYQSYLWNTGAITRTIKAGKAGKYWLTAKDTAACDWIDTVNLTIYPHKDVNLGADQIICTGDVIKLDAGKGYTTYKWSTGDTTDTLSVNYAGIFWVSVTDNNGCWSSDTMEIEIFDHATVSLGNDTILCDGDTMVLSASFPFSTYKWDDGSIDTFRVVTEPGNYSVTITNHCGSVSDAVSVDYISSIDVDLGPDASFCLEQPYQLTASVPGAIRYTWSTGDTTYQISVKEEGYYSVEVEDRCGNIDSDEIELIRDIHPSQMIPNTFTPNHDAINETWKPVVKTYGEYSVLVIDRWGKTVFESDNIDAEWDGNFEGAPVTQGIYNYRISLINCEFQKLIFTGDLNVIR